jgi:hypothetical protein
MHLASTFTGLFVAVGKPYLRASVGHQIKLGEFFEKVGTTLIAQFPREPLVAWETQLKAPSHAGFRQVTRFSAEVDLRFFRLLSRVIRRVFQLEYVACRTGL